MPLGSNGLIKHRENFTFYTTFRMALQLQHCLIFNFHRPNVNNNIPYTLAPSGQDDDICPDLLTPLFSD
jgi:hypothetical protein